MVVKIKKLVSEKTGNSFLAIAFDLGSRDLYVFPKSQIDFCEILNMKPSEIRDLPKDYELKIGEIK